MFIDKIGVELEGGWDERPTFYIMRNHLDSSVVGEAHDGSVRVNASWVGEVRVGPLEFKNLTEWQRVLKCMWPQHTNYSCGMHVHLSFKSIRHYDLLANSQVLWPMLRERLEVFQQKNFKFANSRLAKRLKGDNQYCRTNRLGPETAWKQLRGDEDRYKAVNWCAFPQHGTLEIRVLPQISSPAKGLAMIMTVTNVVEQVIKQELKAFAPQRHKHVVVKQGVIDVPDYRV